MKREDAVNYFIDRGILLSPDFFDEVGDNFDSSLFYRLLNKKSLNKPIVLNKDIFGCVNNNSGVLDYNWNDFDSARVLYEKSNSDTLYSKFINFMVDNSNSSQVEVDSNSSSVIVLSKNEELIEQEKPKENYNDSNVKIMFSYDYKNKKKDVQDFVRYFKHRYESLKRILSLRQELQESVSIARLPRKQEGEFVSVIGMIIDRRQTKNNNVILTLEDPTGSFNVLITKNKEELYKSAMDLVLDEVIGISGVIGNKIIFCNNIYLPEVPVNHELKKCPDEVYAVFISDIHFGIKNFLSSDFMKFIMWIRGEHGNEQQRDIASKIRYLFVVGDVVEGVGIYPGQEDDLEIKDIYDQYDEATRYFKMIPERIKIIVCGGNHDAMRMSEPQPIFDKSISKGFYEIPNMIMVNNPSFVNIHSSTIFPGIDVLMYHGASFPYFGDNVPSIRDKGGIFRCDLIMKFLLQRRHLAPSHSSTLYVPDETCDPLVIEKIPDIFVSGHIHQITVGSYRNVSLINSSCWVVQSEDNAKRGIVPHPAKIPIVNLKTREVRIMNFLDDDVKVLVTERLGLK